MQTFEIIKLSELLKHSPSTKVQAWLETFHCEKNLDIERFLVKSAIRFEQARLSRTYFLLDENSRFLAYFTLSFKSIRVQSSKSQLKKLTGGLTESNQINVFLLAQLGKNSAVENNSISLQVIMDKVLKILFDAQFLIGGRVAILECDDNAKLIQLYEHHGFRTIDTLEDENRLKTMFIIPKLE